MDVHITRRVMLFYTLGWIYNLTCSANDITGLDRNDDACTRLRIQRVHFLGDGF